METKPRWLRDLVRYLPLKSQFVLSGNVRDLQAYQLADSSLAPLPLSVCILNELKDYGYEEVLQFTPMGGFSIPGTIDSNQITEAMSRNGLGTESPTGMGIEALTGLLSTFVASSGPPAALIIDFASRLVNRSDVLTAAEHALFTRAQILSHASKARPVGPTRKAIYNTIIWITERESDLPDWLTLDNPKLRTIPISVPDSRTRRALAPILLRALPGYSDASPSELAKQSEVFVNLTDGLLLSDMHSIAQLGRAESLRIGDIADAVRRYKVGITEDPWRLIDRSKIATANEFIRGRVKGQDHAVTHMLDIIKRAVTGVGRSATTGRPRGVAFLAGPTGTGKTELAKTITSLLFGDETAYIRFDMSEFSAEHADQRLIGAPPGYVGYDAGGELTNAIRERPFSVVLFDEIEKAHPRILDKFLQVLDDGVLTSGRGDRVYFSEAVILFTSNLGIYKTDASGERTQNVNSDETHDVVAKKVRDEIERHFKLVLNRPEILNRIGENIIIFDFIRPDVAEEIFDGMVAAVLDSTRSVGFTLSITPAAKDVLQQICLEDLSNGGRGVRNQVEANLTNPLARALFDTGKTEGSFSIAEIMSGAVTTLKLVAP